MALHLILILTKILKTMHVCKTYNTKREKWEENLFGLNEKNNKAKG
jgi:hypothetical protein